MATATHTNKGKKIGKDDVMKRSEHAPKKTKGPENKKPGYVVKGDKVYYRTKSGKEGSMPKGHVKMVARWGLKPVDRL